MYIPCVVTLLCVCVPSGQSTATTDKSEIAAKREQGSSSSSTSTCSRPCTVPHTHTHTPAALSLLRWRRENDDRTDVFVVPLHTSEIRKRRKNETRESSISNTCLPSCSTRALPSKEQQNQTEHTRVFGGLCTYVRTHLTVLLNQTARESLSKTFVFFLSLSPAFHSPSNRYLFQNLLLLLLLLLDSSIDRSRQRVACYSLPGRRSVITGGKEMKLRLTSDKPETEGGGNRSIPPFRSPSVTKETTGAHTHTKMDRSILYIHI